MRSSPVQLSLLMVQTFKTEYPILLEDHLCNDTPGVDLEVAEPPITACLMLLELYRPLLLH